MRYFDQSSSPVLVMTPHLPPQPSYNTQSTRPAFTSPFANGINQSPVNSSWSNPTPTQATPTSAAGRKRSRDEADDDYFAVQPPPAQKAVENEEEWEYGEGMTLIRKGGYMLEASSQTGTWAEEKAEQEKAKAAAIHALANAAAAPTASERPILRQRLDLSATPAIIEEVSHNGTLVQPASPERHLEPTVDDFTRHLGIGWSSINQADEDIQAAARGWAKFIENHFPVTDAKIRLQSKGLASYLVEANEGYFLFGEDLKQGRLVSTSVERTFANLQGAVPTFEGEVVMEAAGQTPKADVDVESAVIQEHVMNDIVNGSGTENGHAMRDSHGMMEMAVVNGHGDEANATPSTLEVEMDMS